MRNPVLALQPSQSLPRVASKASTAALFALSPMAWMFT